EAGTRGLVDDRLRVLEIGGKLTHLALQQTAERQQIHRAVAVLGEVADGQLAAVAGAHDEVVERVGDEIESRHAEPRLEIRQGQPCVQIRGITYGRLFAREL